MTSPVYEADGGRWKRKKEVVHAKIDCRKKEVTIWGKQNRRKVKEEWKLEKNWKERNQKDRTHQRKTDKYKSFIQEWSYCVLLYKEAFFLKGGGGEEEAEAEEEDDDQECFIRLLHAYT